MPLIEIFRATPIVGVSLLVCLATLVWCIMLVPRLKHSHDRFLVGLVGLLSIYHGLRVLKDTGLWTGAVDTKLEQIGSFAITGLYLLAVLILEVYTTENRKNVLRLRLAEANQASAPVLQVPTDPFSLHDLSQAVMESSPLPMYAVDAGGAVCYWNSAAERLFGWERSEVLGHQLPVLADSEPAPGRRESACYLRKKDGTRIHAEVWTAPIQRVGDSLRGTLTIVGTHAAR
jgi:PAS domain-containing protein